VALGAGLAKPEGLARLDGNALLAAWTGMAAAGLWLGSGLPRAGWIAVAALAVPLQLAGAQRSLRAFDRSFDAALWTRDAVDAICAEEAVLVTPGFNEFQALLLRRHPWAEPFRGTCPALEGGACPAPTPVDVGSLAAASREQLVALCADGRTVVVDARALADFERHPTLGPALRSLPEAFELVPLEHGRFRGYRLEPRR
jgi:hypothetical protein